MTESEGPRFPIRRFDVFADYNRVKNEAEGMPEDQAKGRGLWIAKVVAGRRGMPAQKAPSGDHEAGKDGKTSPPREDEKFYSVGGVPQTDAMFDSEVIDRMGREFYDTVFHPAIERAFNEGKQYTEIRDSIRKAWK